MDSPPPVSGSRTRALLLALAAGLVVYAPWALQKTASFDLLTPWLWAACVHGACLLGGYAIIVRWLPGLTDDVAGRVFLGWTLGAGALGVGMTVLGTLGLFHPIGAAVLLLALAVGPFAVARPPWPSLADVSPGALAALVVITAGCGLVCLAPPLFHDTLTYHLALAQHAAATGTMEANALDPFSAYPALGEMVTAPALLLGSPVAMTVAHAGFFFPLGGLAYVFARRFLDDTGTAAAVVVVTSPLVLFVATNLKPDLLAALFTLAALYGLAAVAEKTTDDDAAPATPRDARVWVGLCAGLVVATRYTGLAWGGLLVLALVLIVRKGGPATMTRDLRAPLVLAVVIGAPAYLKNLIAFGNPVYPMASSVFGGPEWMAKTSSILDGMARRVHDGDSFVDLALLGPVTFTFNNLGTMNDLPGTLPLLLLPLLLLLDHKPPALRLLGGLALVSAPVWLLSQALLRLNPLLFVPVLLVTGWVLGRLARTPVRPLALVVALVLMAGNVLWTVRADAALRRDPWAVITGRLTTEEHLREQYELYGAFAWLNENTPEDARVVLFTGDWRSAYLERAVDRSGRLTPPRLQLALRSAESVADVDAALRDIGTTHVVLTPGAVAREQSFGWMDLPPEKLALLDAFIKAHAPPVYTDRYAQVLSLDDR